MRIHKGLKLLKIGSSYAAVPDGSVEGSPRSVIRLNETAAEIWRGIESGLDLDAVTQSILAQYCDADEETVRDDVGRIIDQLAAAGLLEE